MGKNKSKLHTVIKLPKSGNIKKQLANITELKQSMQGKPLELRFSPTAWSKLIFMRDIGDTEIGGFGITRPDDLLYVEKFITVKQECTSASVEFDDDDVADFTLDMVEDGLQPANFMRIWVHTHPSISPSPSLTDEQTFSRVFGKCDWAIMAILSKDDRTYCRIQINEGPIIGQIEIPIKVDFTSWEFPKSNSEAWSDEYVKNVTRAMWIYHNQGGYYDGFPGYNGPGSYETGFKNNQQSEFSDIEPEQRSIVPYDDAYTYSGSRQYHSDSITIPNELEEFIDANTMILLETMIPNEREYIFDEIRSKFSIGD